MTLRFSPASGGVQDRRSRKRNEAAIQRIISDCAKSIFQDQGLTGFLVHNNLAADSGEFFTRLPVSYRAAVGELVFQFGHWLYKDFEGPDIVARMNIAVRTIVIHFDFVRNPVSECLMAPHDRESLSNVDTARVALEEHFYQVFLALSHGSAGRAHKIRFISNDRIMFSFWHISSSFLCKHINIVQQRNIGKIEGLISRRGGLVGPVPPKPVRPFGSVERFPSLVFVPLFRPLSRGSIIGSRRLYPGVVEVLSGLQKVLPCQVLLGLAYPGIVVGVDPGSRPKP